MQRPEWTLLRACAVALGLLAGAGADAAAQDASAVSERPFRAIFGGSELNRPATGLNLTVSLRQSYDDDLSASGASGGSVPSRGTIGGHFSTANVDMAFDRRTERLTLAATARTMASYYPDLTELSGFSHFGSAAAGFAAGGFRADLAQTIGYSPYYSFVFLPIPVAQGEPIVRDPVGELGLIRRETLFYETRANLRQQLTARTQLAGHGAFRKTDFSAGPGDLRHQSGGIDLIRQFTRNYELSGGYGYQEGHYERGETVRTHDVHVRTRYGRRHSKTRRTFVSLGGGASLMDDRLGDSTFATASAGVRHEMGRTWSANVDYDRSGRYVDGFAEPFLADGVRATLSGFLSRRVDTSVHIGYSTGVIGFGDNAPGFTSYFGTARLRYALSRITAVHAEYLHYRYDFERQPAPDLPARVNRHGARIGLSLWLPLR